MCFYWSSDDKHRKHELQQKSCRVNEGLGFVSVKAQAIEVDLSAKGRINHEQLLGGCLTVPGKKA